MSNPVLVYLDSQDFSRLSPSHRDFQKLRPIRRELLDLREKGLARYAFSDIHVFEMMPTRVALKEFGLERIRTIKELCGSNHLPSSATLALSELRQACGSEPETEWDEWFPYFEMKEPDRSAIFSEVAKELGGNRKQRRATRSALKGSIPTPYCDDFARSIIAKYPFLKGGEKALRNYAATGSGWTLVVAQVKAGMRDIVAFSEWLLQNWEQGHPFVESLRSGNRKVQATLVELYERMTQAARSSPLPEDQIGQLIRSIYLEQSKRVPIEFLKEQGARMIGAATITEEPDPGKAPSLLTAFSFLVEVAYLSAIPRLARNPRKHAGSDFADAMHVLYISKVDIFRADKFSCSVLRKMPNVRGGSLCSSLAGLPEMILESYEEGSRVGKC